MKNAKGFTLIELVMVIVILAVLGVVAIPQFVNLQGEARLSSEAGVAAGVRAGLLTYFIDLARGARGTVAGNPGYPASLDGAAVGLCTTTNACFTTVLAQGGVTDQWTKLTLATGANNVSTYRSSASTTNVWTYTQLGATAAQNGTFVKTTN